MKITMKMKIPSQTRSSRRHICNILEHKALKEEKKREFRKMCQAKLPEISLSTVPPVANSNSAEDPKRMVLISFKSNTTYGYVLRHDLGIIVRVSVTYNTFISSASC